MNDATAPKPGLGYTRPRADSDSNRFAGVQLQSTGSGIAVRRRDESTLFGILFVAMLLIVDSGVPALLIGFDTFTVGRVVSAGLIAIGLLIPQFDRNRNFSILSSIGLMPFILMMLMIAVSIISNTFIFHYGFSNFAPSLYLLMPVLTFYLLRNLGISTGDVIWGFVVSAIFASAIVLIDSVFTLTSLRQMRRLSVFGSAGNMDRLVVLKDACVIALVFLLANVLSRDKSIWRYVLYAFLLALIAFPVFFTFESRFAILVTLLSTALFVSFGRMTASRRVSFYALGLVVGIPGAWIVLQKFIAPMLGSDWESYAATNNVSVRINSLNYYLDWFERSYFVGIGHMSTSPAYKNILSSVVDMAYNLNDLGIYASLFQFGLLGLAITLFMTVYLAVSLFRLGYSGHPRAPEMHILGCYLIASSIQVVPANFFTLTATCMYGSILWYLICRARFEEREAQLQSATLAE